MKGEAWNYQDMQMNVEWIQQPKKVRLGMFSEPTCPEELSDDPQLVEQTVIFVQSRILTCSVLTSPFAFPPDFYEDPVLLLGCLQTFA